MRSKCVAPPTLRWVHVCLELRMTFEREIEVCKYLFDKVLFVITTEGTTSIFLVHDSKKTYCTGKVSWKAGLTWEGLSGLFDALVA